MGLDMYAVSVRASQLEEVLETDAKLLESEKAEEVFYWRKHHDLHGWMESLYREKGGQQESFNCCKLLLTKEDLDNLEKDIIAKKLPATTGFFFGNTPPDDESMEQDMLFIAKAREAIDNGLLVFYDSWW